MFIRTLRIQFKQTRRKFLDKRPKVVCSMSGTGKRNLFFFRKSIFPQNVPVGMQNAHLTNLLKCFVKWPKTYRSMSENDEKTLLFTTNFVLKVFLWTRTRQI